MPPNTPEVIDLDVDTVDDDDSANNKKDVSNNNNNNNDNIFSNIFGSQFKKAFCNELNKTKSDYFSVFFI